MSQLLEVYGRLAKEFGEHFAQEYFKEWVSDFDLYAGPNFTWEHFPDMVKKLASAHYALTLDREDKIKLADKLKGIAADAAYEKTVEIMKVEKLPKRNYAYAPK
jgi:hypothetical protein